MALSSRLQNTSPKSEFPSHIWVFSIQCVRVYVCSCGGGAPLNPGELVGWGEMLAQGGSVKSKAGGLRI